MREDKDPAFHSLRRLVDRLVNQNLRLKVWRWEFSGLGFKEVDWTVSVAVGGGLDGTTRLEVLHERERECVGEMCACRKAGMKRKRG